MERRAICCQMSDSVISTFAMLGALAWQVKDVIKCFFLLGWEIVRGDSAPWVLLCASSLGSL